MKVTAVVLPNNGISYHRFVNPFQYMPWGPQDIHSMVWAGEGELAIDNKGIVLYNKFIATPVDILKGMQGNGMKIVVDVDDWWELPSWHPNHQSWYQQENHKRVADNIKIADLVICTSMLLQDKVRELNKNTVVIPNALPYGYENYKPQPISHDKMCFMYMGGVTHLEDVRLMENKFRRIASDPYIKTNAEFVLCGYEKSKQQKKVRNRDGSVTSTIEDMSNGPYDRMSAVFSYTGSYRVLPTASTDDYIDYYDQADVALCPLRKNEWNSYKSVLKIIECGAKEVPVICSKVEPYYPELKDCPGILWVENNNWLDHIRWCVKHPVQIKELGKQLGQYCREHYDLIKWNNIRYNVLKSL